MFCNQCGHRNAPGSNFCSSCGAALAMAPAEDTTDTIVFNPSEERELEDDLGVSLDELPEGIGMLLVRKGPNAGSRYVLDAEVTQVEHAQRYMRRLRDVTKPRRVILSRLTRDDRELHGYSSMCAGSVWRASINRRKSAERTYYNKRRPLLREPQLRQHAAHVAVLLLKVFLQFHTA